MLVIVYFVVAAAGFCGFYMKWGLHDLNQYPNDGQLSIRTMLDGTSYRPFIYRRLLPYLTNSIDATLPISVRKHLLSSKELASHFKGNVVGVPEYTSRYIIIFYLGFFFFYASLFLMRWLCLLTGCDAISSTIAPAILGLFTPLLLSVGGFIYDFSESFFLMLTATIILRGKPLLLLPFVAALGATNKESYLFFLLTLYPLLRLKFSRHRSLFTMLVLILIAGCVHFLIRIHFRQNAGGTVEWYLPENLKFYLNPLNLINGHEFNYGLPTPRGYSLFLLIPVLIIYWNGWKQLPTWARQHTWIALAINLPLFLLFCAPGEIRNLSLLFVSFLLTIAYALPGWYRHQGMSLETANFLIHRELPKVESTS